MIAFPSSATCADAAAATDGPFLDIEVDNETSPGTYAVGENGMGDVHAANLPSADGPYSLMGGPGTITLTQMGPNEVAGSFDVQMTAVYFVVCDGGCGIDTGYDVFVDAGRLSGSFDLPVCATAL
ncbi:MAG: hypothetical protein JST54_29245 [Deltaproteobacteria bacterium]|nr:hypothetical protein [Deltaproteobacteria bacterium]